MLHFICISILGQNFQVLRRKKSRRVWRSFTDTNVKIQWCCSMYTTSDFQVENKAKVCNMSFPDPFKNPFKCCFPSALKVKAWMWERHQALWELWENQWDLLMLFWYHFTKRLPL
ncbi:hypothetical protein ATANTOWER_022502 [Ataeniobius toweri]|uniref:Uncharacterized protein n=1 Tax=Ataeniobius toweri TaxID=208326 RepID=A0ABU7CCA1_9TELE|nr:hypothetical protein [Ataeniobius toweri]